MVYLDYSSSTPVDTEVLDKYYDVLFKNFGNPNSSHKLGRDAREMIDDATSEIAKLLNVSPDEIILQAPETYSESDLQIYMDDLWLDELPSGDDYAKKFFGIPTSESYCSIPA